MKNPITDKELHQELVKARDRISWKADEVMKWILSFAQKDLKILSAIDWSDLQYELIEFSRYGDQEFKDQDLIIAVPYYNPATAQLTREEIRQLQASTLKALNGILGNRPVSFEFTSLHKSLVPRFMGGPNYKGPSLKWNLAVSSNKKGESFAHALIDLLHKYASRIKRCYSGKECGRIFLADRINQEYCSLRCQSRVAMRKYRKEHGLVSGRPRGRPRKEEKLKGKKKGANHGTHRR